MSDKTHRSAVTGKFVTAEHAKTNPDTTVSESPCAECERLRGVVEALAAKLDTVRATAEHYDGLSYAGGAAAILRALDAAPETGGES